jgi:sugar-specific transcriptional regulator TrmB
MEEKLINLLSSLGFTKSEVDVYLDLLKNDVSTAYSISYRLGQHKSTVYESLRKLLQRGLIIELADEKRKLYQTKDYVAIEEYIKQIFDEARKLKSYIKSISDTKVPERGISLSYGLNRLRAIISESLDKNNELFLWIVPKEFYLDLGDWFINEFNERINENKVSVKMIFSKDSDIPLGIKRNSKIEIKKFKSESNIFTILSKDSVYTTIISNPLTIMEMKSPDISSGFRTRFYHIWNDSKKIRNK